MYSKNSQLGQAGAASKVFVVRAMLGASLIHCLNTYGCVA